MMNNQTDHWKLKRLVKYLSDFKGNGTSMITLNIPPGDQVRCSDSTIMWILLTWKQISRVNKMLTEEYGTAARIKSRENRLSVQSAIQSAQQKLKLYNRVPQNGLAIFCGSAETSDGAFKRVHMDIEPFKPLRRSLYLCDSIFHIEVVGNIYIQQNSTITVCYYPFSDSRKYA